MAGYAQMLVSFATRYTAAWCGGDPAAVAAFFSPDGALTINDGTPAVGREAIVAAVGSFMTAFPDLRVELNELAVRDGRIEYHWTLHGTNTGPGGTGKRVRISGMEGWEFGDDGLIARSTGTFDAADYAHQLEHGAADDDA